MIEKEHTIQKLTSTGDHIRQRRTSLGLRQREVADIIGVAESSIWNWEHGTEPEQKFNPNIIRFLGYIPFEKQDDILGQLTWYKRVNGLTLKQLGKQMKRHPDQLQEWLSGERQPFAKSLLKIERFLAESIKSNQ